MCGGPAWKREIVPDHKFDFIDTREFTDNGAAMRMKYLWLYILILKSFLVYVSDIFTAVTMLSTKTWANKIFQECGGSNCVAIPFSVGQWLFVGCIIFSFLLLAYEGRKTKRIIASRDISYAFTNVMANNYYSLRSYDHFCFFDHIQQSTKKSDDFAFFIFFTFKSWKRLIFADGPRQVINALTLYAIYMAKRDNTPFYNFKKYFAGNDFITTALTISTLFTVLIFAGSFLLLVIAAICYVPLLCYIKGNLKEYCCHKVDKRISEIIRRRNKERTAKAIALAKKEAMGDFSHLKNKKGKFIQQPLPQPTLPNISIDDDLADIASLQKRAGTPSNHTGVGDKYYATDAKAAYDYPTMPAYNMPYSHLQDPNAYARYNPSVPTLPDENQYYEDDYGSTANLAPSSETHGRDDYIHSHPARYHGSQDYVVDPYELYTGHAANGQDDYGGGQYENQPGQYPHNPQDVGYDISEYTDHQTGNQRGYSPPNYEYGAKQFHVV